MVNWSEQVSYGTTNIPLAIGLIIMMYPPLVKVQFSKVPRVFAKTKLMLVSFFVTWIIGPFLMFLFAILFLSDHPDYMTGLIIIGLAPCIAMVIVWNELASGNRELVAGLVGINSLLQVVFFSLYAWFYLEIVLPVFGFDALVFAISLKEIAFTVFIYLGIPFTRDLRFTDNHALNLLAKEVDTIIPLFVYDRAQIFKNKKNNAYFSQRAANFIIENVNSLPINTVFSEDLGTFVKKSRATHIGFNEDFSPFAKKREAKWRKMFSNLKIITCSTDLFLCNYKSYYKVF
ncbi:MAG: hypothetical protein EBS34_11095, partial [Flavobacteriales bacterium]|nr:hypothetical protein [Flavobacteriales bacterium]